MEKIKKKRKAGWVEPNSGIPVAVPLSWKKPMSLEDQVARIVGAFSRQAEANGEETLEESEDFEVGDEPPLPGTIWEEQFEMSQQRKAVKDKGETLAKELQLEAFAKKRMRKKTPPIEPGSGGNPPEKPARKEAEV